MPDVSFPVNITDIGKYSFVNTTIQHWNQLPVKDWGESVSELIIWGVGEGNNYKKLYAVLSYLGVFTFCTCCIRICLVCIVASFKLSC